MTTKAVTRNTSQERVREINRLHAEIEEHLCRSLRAALRIGQLLNEQKEAMRHGEFLPWVEQNLPFSERTAQRYMVLWRERARLKSDTVSDLGQAYRLLSASTRAEREEAARLKRELSLAALPAYQAKARKDWRVLHADVAEASGRQVRSCSVDLVLTDPPYGREFLDCYDSLGAFADRVLKPGGSLVCMAGQTSLPDAMARLGEHLTYQWTCAYLLPNGDAAKVWPRRVGAKWKPLLWYVKGSYSGGWSDDLIICPPDRCSDEFHPWGQSVEGVATIVERFSQPGDRICDPFCGGGSIGIAAVRLGRHYVGIDVDGNAVEVTRRRLTAMD